MATKTRAPAARTDIRPRFGWAKSLDNDPQEITEARQKPGDTPVVVIPLPFMSSKLKEQIREFTKSIWPEK